MKSTMAVYVVLSFSVLIEEFGSLVINVVLVVVVIVDDVNMVSFVMLVVEG